MNPLQEQIRTQLMMRPRNETPPDGLVPRGPVTAIESMPFLWMQPEKWKDSLLPPNPDAETPFNKWGIRQGDN